MTVNMISASHTDYWSQNIVRSVEIPFQKAGNGYLKAGNGLVGHIFLSVDEWYGFEILDRVKSHKK